jgi:signal transduction histidine kinase
VHSDELGSLLSLISHEVRAPLGVMRGYLRLIEQQGTELSDMHRHAIAAALKASERATEILGQVSTLARLHRREVLLSRNAHALEPLLRSAAQGVKAPPDPVVTVHVGDTPAVDVLADEALLGAALSSLIAATVRAQAVDNRVFVLAREERRDAEAGVVITITPMEAESATHAHAPLDIARGGLGVELPIALFVVNAHGGHVLERRERDRFVGVVLWLPIVDR